MRIFIGCLFIKAGMAIIPKGVHHMIRGLLMYHVPNALSEDEKSAVRQWAHEKAPDQIKTIFP